MTPNFKIQEVAQISFNCANYLFSCISDKGQKRSIQEVSLIAQVALNEVRKLLVLLDGSLPSDQKRIRKGPLPNTSDINYVEYMDATNSSFQTLTCNSVSTTQRSIVRPFFRAHGNQETSPVNPSNSLRLIQRSSCEKNRTVDLNQLPQKQPRTHMLHNSSSEVLVSHNNTSMLASKRKYGAKSEETSTICAASTFGCHCSKRR